MMGGSGAAQGLKIWGKERLRAFRFQVEASLGFSGFRV